MYALIYFFLFRIGTCGYLLNDVHVSLLGMVLFASTCVVSSDLPTGGSEMGQNMLLMGPSLANFLFRQDGNINNSTA